MWNLRELRLLRELVRRDIVLIHKGFFKTQEEYTEFISIRNNIKKKLEIMIQDAENVNES